MRNLNEERDICKVESVSKDALFLERSSRHKCTVDQSKARNLLPRSSFIRVGASDSIWSPVRGESEVSNAFGLPVVPKRIFS